MFPTFFQSQPTKKKYCGKKVAQMSFFTYFLLSGWVGLGVGEFDRFHYTQEYYFNVFQSIRIW